MTGHPPYPYSDGTRAILGPDVTATADGNTITWQGATYHRHRWETPDNPPASSGTAGNPLRGQIETAIQAVQDGHAAPVEVGDERIVDAVMGVVQPHFDQLADYENRITWHTTCASCARTLDSCYAETMRAEQAEAQLNAAKRKANEMGAWGVLHIENAATTPAAAHDGGPSVQEAAAADRVWWGGEKTGEQ